MTLSELIRRPFDPFEPLLASFETHFKVSSGAQLANRLYVIVASYDRDSDEMRNKTRLKEVEMSARVPFLLLNLLPFSPSCHSLLQPRLHEDFKGQPQFLHRQVTCQLVDLPGHFLQSDIKLPTITNDKLHNMTTPNHSTTTAMTANPTIPTAGRSFTSENVNFTESLPAGTLLLPVPEPTDDLETTVRKITALARIVEQGRSIAVHTGFRLAAHEERGPEILARKSMTSQELVQYDAWKTGSTMPTTDWANGVKAVPGGAKSQQRMEQRALALNTIFQRDDITTQNASWFTSNMAYGIPLVKAVSEVASARRELTGGQSTLTADELAEIQTAHRVVAIAMDNMNQIYRRLNILSRAINQSKEILQAREHALKTKIDGYKPKQDSID